MGLILSCFKIFFSSKLFSYYFIQNPASNISIFWLFSSFLISNYCYGWLKLLSVFWWFALAHIFLYSMSSTCHVRLASNSAIVQQTQYLSSSLGTTCCVYFKIPCHLHLSTFCICSLACLTVSMLVCGKLIHPSFFHHRMVICLNLWCGKFSESNFKHLRCFFFF